MKHDVVVRPVIRVVSHICVGSGLSRTKVRLTADPTYALDPKRSGHTEMHDERFVRGKDRDQVFGAPIQATYRAPSQSRGKARRERRPEIGPPEKDTDEPRALHRRCQLAADGLDLWELRQ